MRLSPNLTYIPMKKTIFLLVVLILPSHAFSQIEDEIISYVDSTEVLVQRGRRMILNELSVNNYAKVKVIHAYLTDLTREEHYAAFYYLEDLYINMLAGEWPAVDTLMLNYEKLHDKDIYPDSEDLISTLYQKTSENNQQLLLSCRNSQIPDQAKEVAAIFLRFLDQGTTDEEYNKMLKAYKKSGHNSDYKSFEDGLLAGKIRKVAWNFSMGSGAVFATKDLAVNFTNGATFNTGMDLNVDRLFTSLYLQGSSLKLKEPFITYSDTDTLDFVEGEGFSYLEGGLKAGYFLIRSKSFHLAPYLSVSGSLLESNKYEYEEDDDLEWQIFNSFTYGGGLHTEILLYKIPANEYSAESPGYFSLKLEGGYNKIMKFEDSYCQGDTPYFMCALVMGFGKF